MLGRAVAALLTGQVSGTIALLMSRSVQMEPAALSFWRTVLGLPILFSRVRELPFSGKELVWLALGGLCYALDLALWYEALRNTTMVSATLVINLYPLYVALMAWPFLGQRPSPKVWLGMGLALIGGAIVMGVTPDRLFGTGAAGGGASINRGDMLAFMAGIVYAGYFVILAKLAARHRGVVVTAWSNLAMAAWLLPMALILGQPLLTDHWQSWVQIGLMACLAVLGQTLLAFALRHVPASFAAMASNMAVVWAGLADWLIYNQPATWTQAIGGALIITALMVTERRKSA